jgi:beta-aspartyl-peptidase (threonine type)
MTDGKFALAIHGGCGVFPKTVIGEQFAADVRAALAAALEAGAAILRKGGPALDAVEAAVVVMEDVPVFNAGHGAAFNALGEHELDAAIMDGRTLEAGAVAGLRVARNPVRVARGVMRSGDFLLLQGDGADEFAKAAGFETVPMSYFGTAQRREMLAEMKALAAKGEAERANEAQKHGTVGAAARDMHGNLAAATSTGGYTNKPLGRIGDSPIVGAGTYANNATCAISATGKGEYFIRKVLAHEISARMAYLGHDLARATGDVVMHELPEWKSGVGLVAVDRHGNIAMPFNTEGMYRGSVSSSSPAHVAIYE